MELHSRTPIILITIALVFSASFVGATYYTVGDTEGWTYGVDFQTWAKQYNFTVGDSLTSVFSYIKRQHDVYQVVEDTFRSCDASSGVISIYLSGNDTVSLTQAGNYWFLCNVKGHCRGGMRFGVTVVSGSPGGGGGSGGGSPPPPPLFREFQPPPLPAAGGASGAAKGRWPVLLGVLWALIDLIIV